MRITGLFFISILVSTLSFFSTSVDSITPVGPNAIHLTLLHLNDCYELMPASGTDLGGVARVGTLRKQLLAKNPNTFTLLAGDLFAPSALSLTPVPNPGGKTYDGTQMVHAMNAIGVDAACLGNHETGQRGNTGLPKMNKLRRCVHCVDPDPLFLSPFSLLLLTRLPRSEGWSLHHQHESF